MIRLARSILASALFFALVAPVAAADPAPQAGAAEVAADAAGCKADGSCCGAGACAEGAKPAGGDGQAAAEECPCKRAARLKAEQQAEQGK